jgi:hypothetical protein
MAERWDGKAVPQQGLQGFMHISHNLDLGHRLAGSRQFPTQIRASLGNEVAA